MGRHLVSLTILLQMAAVFGCGCLGRNPAYVAASEPLDGGNDGGHDSDAGDSTDDPLVISCSNPARSTGSGLRATYFDNLDFTGKAITRIDPTIDMAFDTASPDPAIGEETFSSRWVGQLQAPVTGAYVFHASYNDGARLFLDERAILYRWGHHNTTSDQSAPIWLEAGQTYDVRFEHYDNTGAARFHVSWITPCRALHIIPATQLHPGEPRPPLCLQSAAPGAGRGLLGEYFPNADLQGGNVARIDAQVDFDWTGSPPVDAWGAGVFSVRWTGKLEAPVTGPVTLIVRTRNGVARFWVDGDLRADSWFERNGHQEIAATIDLESGRQYDLRIEARQSDNDGLVQLLWQWPCQPETVVPSGQLHSPLPPP